MVGVISALLKTPTRPTLLAAFSPNSKFILLEFHHFPQGGDSLGKFRKARVFFVVFERLNVR